MLSKRIKSRRKELKFSQEYMAEKLGITRQGYGHYETGRNEPDSETILKISNILDCSTDYLHGKVDKPTTYTPKEEFLSAVRERGMDYSGLDEDEIEMFHKMINTYIENKKK